LVDRLDRLGRTLDAARAREKLGVVLRIMGQCDAALEALEQAAQAYRAAGDLDRLGDVTGQIGWAHADRGTPAEGVEWLQPVLAILEAGGARHGLAALYRSLSDLLWHAVRHGEQLAAAERAVELARVAGDAWLLAEVTLQYGVALNWTGRGEEALAVLDETARMAESVGDLTTLCHSFGMANYIHRVRGEFDRQRQCIERAVEYAERSGSPAAIAITTSDRGTGAYYAGDWGWARLNGERALAVSRQMDRSWVSTFALAMLGRLCLAQGNWQEASQFLEEDVATAERCGCLPWLWEAHCLLAQRDLLMGHPDAARARLAPLLDHPNLRESEVTELLSTLAWAHAELDEIARADDVVAQALACAQARINRLAMVDVLRVQAMVATRQKRWAEAEHALEEGLALARSMPYPYAEARLLHVYGQMLAAKAEPVSARERLEAALALFQRLGARRDAEWTEQAITDLLQP
jgi:tetratricopeptide (TPR) repeat protein